MSATGSPREPSASLTLEIDGPEAASLAGLGEDNLMLRAARLLADHAGIAAGAALHLQKNLPVAAGIGGGSSDAAAALRALCALWQVSIDEEDLRRLGARLGADVPACLHAGAAWIGGIGEQIEPAPLLPPAGIVLANPRIALPTAGGVRRPARPVRRCRPVCADTAGCCRPRPGAGIVAATT